MPIPHEYISFGSSLPPPPDDPQTLRTHARVTELVTAALAEGKTPYSISLSPDIAFEYTIWRYAHIPHDQQRLDVAPTLCCDHDLPPNSVYLRCTVDG